MAGNTFGNIFKVTTFGESHGVALGCVIDGCPAGLKLDVKDIQKELDHRRPGQSRVSTSRKEADEVQILSGVFAGVTTGTPITLVVFNQGQRSRDYKKLKDVFRPGHADYTWLAKFGIRDYRGGGRSSGRETLARVAAGAVAKKILDRAKIRVIAFAEEIGGIRGQKIQLSTIERNPVRAADPTAAKEMEAAILVAKRQGDSLGGVIRVLARNVPVGLGEPVFDKAGAILGHALLSIGTVKGIEFGDGFDLTTLHGSEANDAFIAVKGGVLKSSNHSGGLLGGITDGDDLDLRLAIKPTASIGREQETVDTRGRAKKIKITGRHDPCVVPRVVPVVEAMTRIALVDLILLRKLNQI